MIARGAGGGRRSSTGAAPSTAAARNTLRVVPLRGAGRPAAARGAVVLGLANALEIALGSFGTAEEAALAYARHMGATAEAEPAPEGQKTEAVEDADGRGLRQHHGAARGQRRGRVDGPPRADGHPVGALGVGGSGW